MPTIKAREGQCLVDIAMQESGDASLLFQYAVANGMGITDHLEVGEDIEALPVVLNGVVAVLNKRPNYPASDCDDNGDGEGSEGDGEGIDYWFLNEYEVQ